MASAAIPVASLAARLTDVLAVLQQWTAEGAPVPSHIPPGSVPGPVPRRARARAPAAVRKARYTRIVSRGLHRIASLVLLGVLSGAPAVAVICAELCAPAAHQQQTEHDGSSCHGRTGSGPAMTGQPAPDCGDHGAATVGARASLVASRGSSLAVLHVVDADRGGRARSRRLVGSRRDLAGGAGVAASSNPLEPRPPDLIRRPRSGATAPVRSPARS